MLYRPDTFLTILQCVPYLAIIVLCTYLSIDYWKMGKAEKKKAEELRRG